MDSRSIETVMIQCIKDWHERICYKIRRHIQGIKQGFPESDTWSLDYTIAKFTLPRLKRLRVLVEKHGGVPAAFSESGFGQDPSLMSDEEYDIAHAKDLKKWLEVIDKMIVAFELILNDDDLMHDFPEQDLFDKDGNYVPLPKEWSKKYMKRVKLREKKIKEGLTLFGKYFQALWW